MKLKRLWRYLSSRGFALWLLLIVIFTLILSAFLPNEFTLTEEELLRLQTERPFLWKVSRYLSTPAIVTSPLFVAVSFFLALSTILCTYKRLQSRQRDFSKTKAFHFKIVDDGGSRDKILKVLDSRGWSRSLERASDNITLIKADKGRYGFWGSIIFHISLIAVFITAIISSVTRFNGEILAPENTVISASDNQNYISLTGTRPPGLELSVTGIRLSTSGPVPTQLMADIHLGSDSYEIAVNKPVTLSGYQIAPSRYGVSPRFVILKEGREIFNFFINLRSLFMDDSFEIKEEGLRFVVRFFPDFYREGKTFGTRGLEEKNPVFYIRLFKEGSPAGSIFLKPGEDYSFGNYTVKIPEYSHWITLIISRDLGTFSFIISFIFAILGLFIRFMSNERVMTVLLSADGRFELRGWSRYYPAFLEKEMNDIRDEIKG